MNTTWLETPAGVRPDGPEPVLVVSAGLHARALAYLLAGLGCRVAGFIEPRAARMPDRLDGLPVWPEEDIWAGRVDPGAHRLVMGMGTLRAFPRRWDLAQSYQRAGFAFLSLIAPRALVWPSAKLGEGGVVLPGAVVGHRCQVGPLALVNTGAILEHDCSVGKNVHVATGAVVAGHVTLGDHCHVGAGAVIRDEAILGPGVTVGAGAVVVGDVAAGLTVVGNPARELQSTAS